MRDVKLPDRHARRMMLVAGARGGLVMPLVATRSLINVEAEARKLPKPLERSP